MVRAAFAGIAAVVAAAGVGELVAAFFAPGSSPFAAVGGALIDVAPSWAKDLAIAWFGTADKAALLVGIAIVMLLVAAGAGILQAWKPPLGVLVAAVAALAGAIIAATRPNAGNVALVPSVIAGVVAVLAMRALVRLAVAGSGTDAAGTASARPASTDRRRLLIWSGVATVFGVVTMATGAAVRAGSQAVTTVRRAFTLPEPAVSAPPVPAGAELGIPGLAPVVTPNTEYYRIDTALVVPNIDPAHWSLRVHGMVENEIEIGWDELLTLPMHEAAVTLACVSNEVGGSLIGNALWLGHPIREVLARAKPLADADMVLSRSLDGWTAGTPLEVLTDDRDALLAVGMNGEALPQEHGFPVRMVVPGLYGYVSATKWVVELEVTRFDRAQGYWTPRGWSALGPIKLQSRIDVPRGNAIEAGDTMIAGVAWQQHVGVAAVEVQVDDSPWQQAELATAISDDTWVQWSLPWQATSGNHRVRCRATNVNGETQTSDLAAVAPDGATGWHTIGVSVR